MARIAMNWVPSRSMRCALARAAILEPIARFKAHRLIYVSCDLSTIVRDLPRLILDGYKMHVVRGFDFFPNTHHIEIVASLVLT